MGGMSGSLEPHRCGVSTIRVSGWVGRATLFAEVRLNPLANAGGTDLDATRLATFKAKRLSDLDRDLSAENGRFARRNEDSGRRNPPFPRVNRAIRGPQRAISIRSPKTKRDRSNALSSSGDRRSFIYRTGLSHLPAGFA